MRADFPAAIRQRTLQPLNLHPMYLLFRLRIHLWLVLLAGLAVRAADPRTGAALSAKPNVVFIAIDDQNDWVGPLGGHPFARTPSMDRLARRGTTFVNAHCNAPCDR